MLLDIGMRIIHKGKRYNCKIYIWNHMILLIRPKTKLAMDGNYYEKRWFSEWTDLEKVEKYYLPAFISKISNQISVPFGVGSIHFTDVSIAAEICEELFVHDSLHSMFYSKGIDIILNGSASYFECGKYYKKCLFVQESTEKSGCLYAYCNALGCDGDILYFDGGNMACLNGKLLLCSERFLLDTVSVQTLDFCISEITGYRKTHSMSKTPSLFEIHLNSPLFLEEENIKNSLLLEMPYQSFFEEMELATTSWL